jgi:hypothetical protein
LDEYDVRARLIAAVFVTLPAVFALFALLPSLRTLLGIVGRPTIQAVLAACASPDRARPWQGDRGQVDLRLGRAADDAIPAAPE